MQAIHAVVRTLAIVVSCSLVGWYVWHRATGQPFFPWREAEVKSAESASVAPDDKAIDRPDVVPLDFTKADKRALELLAGTGRYEPLFLAEPLHPGRIAETLVPVAVRMESDNAVLQAVPTLAEFDVRPYLQLTPVATSSAPARETAAATTNDKDSGNNKDKDNGTTFPGSKSGGVFTTPDFQYYYNPFLK